MAFEDSSRDSKLTDFGKETLSQKYCLPGESPEDVFRRVANTFGSNKEHSDRLFKYMTNLWFMPSTPILANGGTDRGFPISCYLNSVDDTMSSIIGAYSEMAWLSCRGGGIGTYYGRVREIGSSVKGMPGAAEGVVPWMTIQNSYTRAVNQGNTRGASSALYLDIDHPEIEEFLEIRKPTGGDPDRKALYCHHGVVVSDEFMSMLDDSDSELPLISRFDGSVVKKINARKLWSKILQLRIETGEPYILFKDAVSRGRSQVQTALGQIILQSNLCTEITLETNDDKTAVCCLSSVNAETFLEWRNDDLFIHDVLEMLDNVLTDFAERAGKAPGFQKAVRSVLEERAVGLGVMGFHGFLMDQKVPFESAVAVSWNRNIFNRLRRMADIADEKLADERGPCPAAARAGVKARFTTKLAVAPTASISIICGGATPGIEPTPGNIFIHKTDAGTRVIKNKYLERVLKDYCQENDLGKDFVDAFWKQVVDDDGSVRNVKWMAQDLKDVFKTAFELDQHWIVEHAAHRTPMIDQSQSVNLFFAGGADKKYINSVHQSAWKKGLKTLYYCRSSSVVHAKTVGHSSAGTPAQQEECLACQ